MSPVSRPAFRVTVEDLTREIREMARLVIQHAASFFIVLFVLLTSAASAVPVPKAQPKPAAPTQASSPAVQRGEIAIEGTVLSLDAATKTLALEVHKVTLPGGKPTEITPVRKKTVSLTDFTIMRRDVGAANKLNISSLKIGEVVSVIGRDLGIGKPLPARLVIIRSPEAAEIKVASASNEATPPQTERLPSADVLNGMWANREIPVSGILDPRCQRAEAIMLETMKEFDIPGAVFAISRRNEKTKRFELIVSRGYGFMDKDLKVPTSPNALARIASVDKISTATAIKLILQEGWSVETPEGPLKVSLDTPIFKALFWLGDRPPKLCTVDSRIWRITIGHVLEHKGALRECSWGWDVSDELGLNRAPNRNECVQWLYKHCPESDPGVTARYSNTGYWLLMRFADLLVKSKYSDGWLGYLKERVFKPAGTTDIALSPISLKERNPAEMYYWSTAQSPSLIAGDKRKLVSIPNGGQNTDVLYCQTVSAPAFVRYLSYWQGGEPRPLINPRTGDLSEGMSNGILWFYGNMAGTRADILQARWSYTNTMIIFNRNDEVDGKKMINALDKIRDECLIPNGW